MKLSIAVLGRISDFVGTEYSRGCPRNEMKGEQRALSGKENMMVLLDSEEMWIIERHGEREKRR